MKQIILYLVIESGQLYYLSITTIEHILKFAEYIYIFLKIVN